jgi:hypothetical protein
VRGLAEGIYGERSWERLPVLADALEDAGCTDAVVLGHCRSGGEHAGGCWVVDLVLVVEALEGRVRGEAPAVGGDGGRLDARLQAVCDEAAGLWRKALAKVRLSDLAGAAGGARAKRKGG